MLIYNNRQSNVTRMLLFVLWFSILNGICFIITPDTILAGGPEYMDINLKAGQALEIKGYWDDEKEIFVATDIEELPKPRRPKLRGKIQKINAMEKTITMFGISILIRDKTEFIEDDEEVSFKDLEVGQRIEVSCKVDKEGHWKARKIQTRISKKSNKIKATITGTSVDGKPPDTLDFSGLLIILNKGTDFDKPESHLDQMEDILFGDLAKGSSWGLTDGYQHKGILFFTGSIRQTLRNEKEYDLTKQFQTNQDNIQPDIRLEMSGYWNNHLRSYAQFRLRKKYIISSENNYPSGKLQTNFIQLFFLARNIGGKGFALQVGRQDFDEPREWLFDEYLDAIRIFYYGMKPLLVEAAIIHMVDPLKPKNKTWTDLFSMVRWYLNKKNYFAAYVLSRHDSNELRKRQPIWWGIRYYGKKNHIFRPWFDFTIMRGEDKHKKVRADAIDIGATIIAEDFNFKPSLTLGYAQASGDNNRKDLIDNRFRQTKYEDNVDKFGGITSVRYYGTVLDPELSNIKIVTVGTGVRPSANSSLELIYFSYRQHKLSNKIKGSNLLGTPFSNNANLGWAVDLVIGVRKILEYVRLNWTLGLFTPGEAFKPLLSETAFLSKININVGF